MLIKFCGILLLLAVLASFSHGNVWCHECEGNTNKPEDICHTVEPRKEHKSVKTSDCTARWKENRYPPACRTLVWENGQVLRDCHIVERINGKGQQNGCFNTPRDWDGEKLVLLCYCQDNWCNAKEPGSEPKVINNGTSEASWVNCRKKVVHPTLIMTITIIVHLHI